MVNIMKYTLACFPILLAMVVNPALPEARAASPTAPIRPELALSAEPAVGLDEGWKEPPLMSRTQCWWWWLNGNVTKEAITQDLEAMKAKGFGGANIIDAGGADQRGNRQVPHGPDFGSPAWRELFVHALKEADRLGLELGFNIQSGWNLGGPTVRPEQAAKKLAYAELQVDGGQPLDVQLPQPPVVGGFYRDVAVLAVPLSEGVGEQPRLEVSADSAQPDHRAALVIDNDPQTFWVSAGTQPGEGPTTAQPVLLGLDFSSPATVTEVVIHPRDGYGPRRGWLQYSDSPQRWHVLTKWSAAPSGDIVLHFPRTTAQRFRLVIVEAYDPRSPFSPRNVQIAEIEFKDGDTHVAPAVTVPARIGNFEQKAYYQYPGPFTAPKADHLLNIRPPEANEREIHSNEVLDLTEHATTGRLRWNAPAGRWLILRFGYTLSGSRVSTSSQGWNGWAIDYLDPAAFDEYWSEVAGPILDAARPYVGRSLKFLHTDSWELGPINWTPALPQQFQRLRGYDPTPYLPALAGYVVDDPVTANRFLNDFRRTLADLIADGKYAHFRQHAHELNLGIHPESGGPHAAPIDALQCLGRNDVPMGEFWARSRTHRVHDYERLFTKQAASAAHVYGKRFVLAEAFTSIGPQWEQSPRDLKPVFDRVACEGLNLVMFHTYDCSPDEMGEPGQAYFAGTHVNRHITWWNHFDAWVGYLDRCQFMLQQGLPVSDVLYFYGENVPSFVRLKDDDPARVLPGYDYDVINAEALIERTSVRDGRIVLPEGTSYEMLVLPQRNCYGLAALQHVASLVDAGATVVGPRPSGPIGLSGDPQYETKFHQLVDRLWNRGRTTGTVIANGARGVLRRHGIDPDFIAGNHGDNVPKIDYIHRRATGADIYFVVNRLDRWQDADCSFRIAGRLPELWDPLTGEVADAQAFWQAKGRTVVPLRFPPNGSRFVVFRRQVSRTARGPRQHNEPRPTAVRDIAGPWQVQFDPDRGGPSQPVRFDELTSWSDRPEDDIKYYSGPAVYHTTFDLDADDEQPNAGRRWWIDLGNVENVASVKLNGSELGVAWTDPFRAELTGHLQPAGNKLQIEVTNLWPNRLIGDQRLPVSERRTSTNITKFRADSPLLPSGLLGPVRLLSDVGSDGP